MSDEGLTLSREGATLLAVIDRGDENRFSTRMAGRLGEAIVDAERDRELRFVRLRALGPCFCLGRDQEGETPDELRAIGSRIAALNEAMRQTSLTVVCEVGGDAAGFGAGLVAAADVAVAAEAADVWFPELARGLPPAVVIAWLAKLMPHKHAFELVATGRRMPAAEARERGLVTEVVPAERIREVADRWIEDLSILDAAALRDSKRLLARCATMDERDATQTAPEALALAALRLRGSS